MKFLLPSNMRGAVTKIMEGEYDIPIKISQAVRILDLGANVGAFTFWAIKKWQCISIDCYEPLTENYKMLEDNVKNAETSYDLQISLHKVAVGDTSLTRIYKGKTNCGEASLYKLKTTTDEYEDVVTISPETLPYADIVKIDTEGSEVDIIKNMPFRPMVYLFEYHNENDRRTIDALLYDYILVGCTVPTYGCGVAKYIREDCIKPAR